MKLLMFAVLLLSACALSEKYVDHTTLEASIIKIENGITPVLQIQGRAHQSFTIQERMQAYGVQGLSWDLAYAGEVIVSKAYGMADIAAKRPITPETLLQAGSISKPISALRALQLVEQGKLHLDQNINAFISSW